MRTRLASGKPHSPVRSGEPVLALEMLQSLGATEEKAAKFLSNHHIKFLGQQVLRRSDPKPAAAAQQHLETPAQRCTPNKEKCHTKLTKQLYDFTINSPHRS